MNESNEKKSGRVLCIDFGDKRTGLAVSDESRFIATGLCTVTAQGLKKLAETIKEKTADYSISEIVMGLPVNMDGSESNRAEKTKKFADILSEYFKIPVILQDERLTTDYAYGIMDDIGTRQKNKKKNIDTLSAEIILQEYLDSERK